MTSKKQRRRQSHRETDGKYAKVNPCYHCGRSAGVEYFTHRETDGEFGDEGLCLCAKCSTFLESLPNAEALRRLKLANYGENPQPRK